MAALSPASTTLTRVESMIAEAARAGWARPPRPTVSAWAAEHRVVLDRASANPGRWSNAKTPYLTALMDDISDPAVREISVIKAEQHGFTEALINAFGWVVDVEPGPMLWVFPTLDVAKEFNRDRLMPFIKGTPAVARHLTDRKQDLTGLEVRFDRMTLRFAGSNSDSNLESFAYRYVFIDEYDRCRPGIYTKVKGRVVTFRKHKIVNGGTPELEDSGIHGRFSEGDGCEFMVPCPHCGRYGKRTFDNVKWPGSLQADPADVLTNAYYRCPECMQEIFAAHNAWQLSRGVWVPAGCIVTPSGVVVPDPLAATEPAKVSHDGPTRPAPTPNKSPAHRSRWIRGLLSPFSINPYGHVASEFVQAQGKVTRDWMNRRLGEPWTSRSKRIEHHELMILARPIERGGHLLGELPSEETLGGPATLLTSFVDVQADRLYALVVAWGPLREVNQPATAGGGGGRRDADASFVQARALVDVQVFPRSSGDQMAVLEEYLARTFVRADRRTGEIQASAAIDLALIDSSYWTDEVYDVCRPKKAGKWRVLGTGPGGATVRTGPRVFPSKGYAPPTPNPKPWWWSRPELDADNKPLPTSVSLLIINTDVGKTRLFDHQAGALTDARTTDAEGNPRRPLMAFAENTPEWVYKQLTSEQRVLENVRGRERYVWKARGDRENHLLDCWVGVEALASLARATPELRAGMVAAGAGKSANQQSSNEQMKAETRAAARVEVERSGSAFGGGGLSEARDQFRLAREG